MNSTELIRPVEWTNTEKFLFRVLFVYFLIQVFPLDWNFYERIFQINFADLAYRDLFYVSRYSPNFFNTGLQQGWGTMTMYNWLLTFVIAIGFAFAWTFFDRKRKQYDDLYYILRVVLRYRLALGIIAYGFIHLFPMQLPYPSISLKNTNYGEFTDWKIASISYGVAPGFESFLGIFEILAALLLLHRKSASIGAVIAIGFLGNVFLSNLAYSGGEVTYSLHLLLLAIPIVYFDWTRWYKIIMLGKPAFPNLYQPHFFTKWKYYFRLALRVSFLSFLVLVLGSCAYAAFLDGGYQYPKTKGLPGVAGLYNVSEFRLNGKAVPYSLTDSIRWHDVVFEPWATISIRNNQKPHPDLSNREELSSPAEFYDYESSGSSGRHFYEYRIDSVKRLLLCRNKNKNLSWDRMVLHYSRPKATQIILSGLNTNHDSLYIVLDRINKIYLLDESFKIPQNRSVFE